MPAMMLLAVACTPTLEPGPKAAATAPVMPPSHDPAELPELTAEPPAPSPPLCLNELVASNQSTWPGPAGTYPDWVELHNPTPVAVSLDGWSLHDGDEPLVLQGMLEPMGFRLVALGDEDPFRLDADGDTLALRGPDGREQTVHFGALPVDRAAFRQTDCCPGDCWATALGGTPGSPNTPGRWLRAVEPGEPLLVSEAPEEGWQQPGHDDSAWSVGQGGAPGPAGAFAARRQVPRPSRGRLGLQVAFADGVIVWLDGHEVYRDNAMPGSAPLTGSRVGAWRGSLHEVAPEGPPLELAVWVMSYGEDQMPWVDLQVELLEDP